MEKFAIGQRFPTRLIPVKECSSLDQDRMDAAELVESEMRAIDNRASSGDLFRGDLSFFA